VIDLHSHTTESDGTFSPEALIAEARRVGVRTLAITDHDTFSGFDRAALMAPQAGMELVCGIELSTKFRGQSVHLLGYFLREDGLDEIRSWVLQMQASRHDRNVRLVSRLTELGVEITLEEVQARGRGMTGRPHFAQLLLEKGYVSTLQQAFDDYLDASAKGYVQRSEPQLTEAVTRIRRAGGIASLAHPIRVKGDIAALLPEMRDAGLNAIEAYHSDHSPEASRLYVELARQHGLLITGGSDFHGSAKPGLELGTGRGKNLRIPENLMEQLRAGQREIPRSPAESGGKLIG
jgi:hypothetical protein